MRTRRYGTFEVFSPSLAPERADGPTVQAAARGVRAGGHRTRRCRCRADPGHRVGRRADAHGRDGSVRPRRAGEADPDRRRPRSAADCRSTPTAAAWPTASRSARRDSARCTRTCCSCAALLVRARCPATRRSPSPTSTAPRVSVRARCCRRERDQSHRDRPHLAGPDRRDDGDRAVGTGGARRAGAGSRRARSCHGTGSRPTCARSSSSPTRCPR